MMHLPIVRSNGGLCDVAILYPQCIVFASALDGIRAIHDYALGGNVPFATLSVPTELGTPRILARLSGYEHHIADLYADTFVARNGIVHGASFDSSGQSIPAINFWRAIAALYRYELNKYQVEW